MTFERVLFPVDFSDRSRETAPYVRELARRFDSEVLLMHVLQFVTPPYGPAPETGYLVVDQMQMLHEQRRQEFETLFEDEFAGIRVRRNITEGDPAHEIIDCATTERISLIMMPTHGYGPFRALLLGSVVAKVLHDAACPVWTSAHTEEVLTHPPQAWRRILCAIDTNADDIRVAKWACELATEENAQLCFAHAIHDESLSAHAHDKLGEVIGPSARDRTVTVAVGHRSEEH